MNRRTALALTAALPLPQALANSDAEVESFLATLLEPGKRYANIEPAEGRYLRDLVLRVRARRALEIGTSTGYSGIWIALGLKRTGGRLITLEIDERRHRTARENFRAAGVADLVEARLGDARVEISRVDGPLDLVFIDAHKPDYLHYYEGVIGKTRQGGVIVAHNVLSHPEPMADFLARIKSDPRVRTEIASPGWQGFSVSWVR